MGGRHLILILACNWSHYIDKNVLFQNMEMSSTKMILIPRKDRLKYYRVMSRNATQEHDYKWQINRDILVLCGNHRVLQNSNSENGKHFEKCFGDISTIDFSLHQE